VTWRDVDFPEAMTPTQAGKFDLLDGDPCAEPPENQVTSYPRSSIHWIADHAAHLAASGKTQGNNWTLAQMCEHLARAIETTIRGSAADGLPTRWRNLSSFQRAQRWFIKHAMLLTGWFPAGAPAPESVRPDDEADLEKSLKYLRAAIFDFERKMRDASATWGYHSMLGRMTGRLWRRFHRIHAKHHFSFVR